MTHMKTGPFSHLLVMSIGCSLFWANTGLAYWAGKIGIYETEPPPSNFEQFQRSGLRALEQLVHLHGLGSGCTQTTSLLVSIPCPTCWNYKATMAECPNILRGATSHLAGSHCPFVHQRLRPKCSTHLKEQQNTATNFTAPAHETEGICSRQTPRSLLWMLAPFPY